MAFQAHAPNETTPRNEVPGGARRRAAVAAVAVAVLGLVALSGCASTSHSAHVPSSSPSSLPGGDPSPGMGFDTKVGATCGVLSVIETNLNNALVEHTRGTMNDTSYATIIDTVIPDLRVIGGLAGYGLQVELKNLSSAIEKSPGKLTGADFDPDTDVFNSAFERVSQKCGANDSPLTVSSTTG